MHSASICTVDIFFYVSHSKMRIHACTRAEGPPPHMSHVPSSRQVGVHETVYGDGFGWNFLIDATLTATRIRTQALEKVRSTWHRSVC